MVKAAINVPDHGGLTPWRFIEVPYDLATAFGLARDETLVGFISIGTVTRPPSWSRARGSLGTDQTRILDCDGALVGKHLRELQVSLVERTKLLSIDGERAQQPLAR